MRNPESADRYTALYCSLLCLLARTRGRERARIIRPIFSAGRVSSIQKIDHAKGRDVNTTSSQNGPSSLSTFGGSRPGSRTRLTRRGFSLLEIMIVIAIMLLLAGFVGFNLLGARDDAKTDMAKLQLDQFRNSLMEFNIRFGRFPTEEEGLSVLWSNETLDADLETSRWRRFTEQALPNDPWNNEWVYRTVASEEDDGLPYELFSVGPDGQEGTDDDIYPTRGRGSDRDGAGGSMDFGPSGGSGTR